VLEAAWTFVEGVVFSRSIGEGDPREQGDGVFRSCKDDVDD
jgi:hypothetical protein